MLDKPQQLKALEYGFRPADPEIPLSVPLDAAHGVDVSQPQTILEVPSAEVIAGIEQREERGGDGAHPAGGHDAVFAPLERREALLQMPGCGTVLPRVLELVEVVPGEDLQQLIDIGGELIGIGHVNGSPDRTGIAVDSLACVNTGRIQAPTLGSLRLHLTSPRLAVTPRIRV